MLTAARQQLDRAESMREQIDRDGDIVRKKGSLREHPGLKHELGQRFLGSNHIRRRRRVCMTKCG